MLTLLTGEVADLLFDWIGLTKQVKINDGPFSAFFLYFCLFYKQLIENIGIIKVTDDRI